MKLIGLAGPAGVGKDTIADYLVDTHAFTKFSFSDALYEEVAQAFNIDKAKLYERDTKEKPTSDLLIGRCRDWIFRDIMWKQLSALGYAFCSDVLCSPRQVLQWWGTEYRRKQDPEYWIKKAALFVEAYLRHVVTTPGTYRGGLVNCSVRFPNERAFIEQYNGEVWHVQRPDWDKALQSVTSVHVAERGLKVLSRDKLVLNNGTIEQLGTASTLLLSSEAGTSIKCGVDTAMPSLEIFDRSCVTCLNCGWVHKALTRAEAQAEVDQFNSWFVEQPANVKECFGNKQPTVENYEGCDRCGATAFRPTKPSDAPDGCTIGPVIYDPAAEEADKRFGQPHYGH